MSNTDQQYNTYLSKSGKKRIRTIVNTEEQSTQYTVLKNAINNYTPIVKGLLHGQLVAERSAEDRKKIMDLRNEKKTRFCDEDEKRLGVSAKKYIESGEWVLEMTGNVYLDSEVKSRADMDCGTSHHLYEGIKCGRANEAICMAVWQKETIGMYVRRSCQPTCQLVHFFGTELHLIIKALKPMNRGDEVTLAHEPDCLGSKFKLKCAEHEENPGECPMELKRLMRKARNENPAAYTFTVTMTESGEEETIVARVPNQPSCVEEVVVSGSSSDSTARLAPEAPESPPSEALHSPPPKKRCENEQRVKIMTETPLERHTRASCQRDHGEASDRASKVAEADEDMDVSTSGNQEEVDEPPRAVSPLNNVASSSTSLNMVVRMPIMKRSTADEPAAVDGRGVANDEAEREAAANARRNRASINANSSRNNTGNNEYAVEKIVGKRTTQRGIEYLVKWEGWPEDSNTWEPLKNLNCMELVNRYEKEKTTKAGRPGTVARRQLPSTSTQSPRRGDQNLKRIKTVRKENGDLQFNCEMQDGSEKCFAKSVVYSKYGTKAVQFFDKIILAQMEEGESRS